MIKVEVQSSATRVLPFKNRDGSDVLEQGAWGFFYDRDGNPDNHPRSISVRLNTKQEPYPQGIYWLHPASLYVGDFGAMKVSPTARLIPNADFGKFLQGLISPLKAAA